jgi:hypothetical protein
MRRSAVIGVVLAALFAGCSSTSNPQATASSANGVLTAKATGKVSAVGAPGSGTRLAFDALELAHAQPSLYPALAIPAVESLRCVANAGFLSCLGRTKDGRHILTKLTVRKDTSLSVACVALWRGSGPVVGCVGADTRDFTHPAE